MDPITELAGKYSFEELAGALYMKGEIYGINKVTDKTKWRESVMAEKLGHRVFPSISAGKDSDRYGADAAIPDSDKMAEYKSQALVVKQLRNLREDIKNERTGAQFSPLKAVGVYNGAFNHEAIDAYINHEHFFGIFYKEKCVMIIKVNTDEVERQLRETLNKRIKENKKGKTSNLNSVTISLNDTHLYDVAYKSDSFFSE